MKAAGVLADRELAHPLEDEQLDFGDVGQADERFDIAGLIGARPRGRPASSRNRHPLDEVVDDRFGRQAVAGRMRPEPDAMAEHVGRQILDVLRIDFVAALARAAPRPWPVGPSR